MLLKLCQPIEGFVEKITSLKALAEAYDHIIASGATEENFPEVALKEFNISYEIADNGLDRIPRTGPVVVVANHPFGGIEGVILIDLLNEKNTDLSHTKYKMCSQRWCWVVKTTFSGTRRFNTTSYSRYLLRK